MKTVWSLEFKDGSQEERLPGFSPEFPYLATRAELDRYLEPAVPWHWHRAVELFYMESGSLEYTTPNGKWTFPAGSGGFVNSNVLHTSRATRRRARNTQLLHLFEPSLIAGEFGGQMEKKYVLPLISDPAVEVIALRPEIPAEAALLEQICAAFQISEEEWGYEFRLREALTRIWMGLLELTCPAAEQKEPPSRAGEPIKELMIYIHEHYGQPISVEELAREGHISKRACFRLFRETLHMTPVEYIRACRLRAACRLLAESGTPLSEIAQQCGLGSGSYFGKVFREAYGCTPTEYRRRWHDRDRIGRK